MDNLKSQIKKIFCEEIDFIDLKSKSLTKNIFELKLNTIMENILQKVDLEQNISIPITQTTNENIFDGTTIESGKSSDIELRDNYFNDIKPKEQNIIESTTIPSNFTLTYEMKQFAKSKFIQNPEDIFEDFKLYYQSKATINSDWEAVWKRWVLNKNKYTNHLIKTVIDENLQLNNSIKEFAKKYIEKDNIELEFLKFKNHYIATGDLKVSWDKVWENWCINHKQFKQKEQSQKSKEKSDYRWDFKKAKEVSDRIKDWLEFDKKINWLDDFYWKNIPIPGIGWQKVMHPDFNKEEILLYKIDSTSGNFMLGYKSNDIIDAEVLEND